MCVLVVVVVGGMLAAADRAPALDVTFAVMKFAVFLGVILTKCCPLWVETRVLHCHVSTG